VIRANADIARSAGWVGPWDVPYVEIAVAILVVVVVIWAIRQRR
jgi:hypothetical protein